MFCLVKEDPGDFQNEFDMGNMAQLSIMVHMLIVCYSSRILCHSEQIDDKRLLGSDHQSIASYCFRSGRATQTIYILAVAVHCGGQSGILDFFYLSTF